jgi:hypothetical protein
MKYIIMTLLTLSFLVGPTQAAPIELEISTSNTPSGSSTLVTEEFRQFVKEHASDKISFKAVNRPNCRAVMNDLLKNPDTKMIVPWASNWAAYEDGACDIEWEANKLVGQIYNIQFAVCSRKDTLTFADLKDSGKELTIAVPNVTFNKWAKSIPTGASFKPIPYESSGQMWAGFMAGDTDLVAGIVRWYDALKTDQVDCHFSTNPAGVSEFDIPAAKDMYPGWNFNTTGIVSAFIANGLTESEVAVVRGVWMEFEKTQSFQGLLAKYNWPTKEPTLDEFLAQINTSRNSFLPE